MADEPALSRHAGLPHAHGGLPHGGLPQAPLPQGSLPARMPGWLGWPIRAVTALNRGVFLTTAALMAVVVPVMLYEVIARYGFNAPTTWAMELAVLLFGPYFLLGGPWLLHLQGHVGLDIVRQRAGPVWQRRLDLLNYPVIIGFCLILLWYSVPAVHSAWSYRETSFSAWNPPVWPAKLAVPLALVLMALQACAEWLVVLYRDGDGRAVP